ncbi:MAG: [FeFe] hydrogenase H-cluster maturation GTPase HydF [Halanaerobium sp.]|nr:[FeFe] hydrogenase H-cluster maturation GTPase HydF [Halanaerobium sp.]
MLKTPSSNRINIGIFGKRNAGKSQLLNALTGQDVAVVSSVKGTTTDPVKKAMEFIPLGPVLFIDTAGLDDRGDLGTLRVEKTLKAIQRTDFAIYVHDATSPDDKTYDQACHYFKRFHIPYIAILNKIDLVSGTELEKIQAKYPEAFPLSAKQQTNIFEFKDKLVERIRVMEEDPPIVGDLLPYNSSVILVVPIDSEAPKGRIILPQVQVIRDCLDHGIKSYVVRDTELESALEDLGETDLVITDSQAFRRVGEIVPKEVKLTSFSILFARHKGDLNEFLQGTRQFQSLKDGDKILISETCTHNVSCEDIGRVKIPTLIRESLKKDLEFKVYGGQDFPLDLKDYRLVIHCGACMLNRKAMQSRLHFCQEQGIPITNYGMTLAYFNGILDRAVAIFEQAKADDKEVG